MGLLSSITSVSNTTSVVAKAVTTTSGSAKNASGLDAASVNEVLKDENAEAEEEVSSGPSSSQTASKASGIFSSNRPAAQSPFPTTPVASGTNSSQQAPTMPPMGAGGGAGAAKVADDLKNLLGQKPNQKNNEPWKGNGAKEEEKTPDKLTPPVTENKAIEVKDEKRIKALNEAYSDRQLDPRKALLVVYTDAKDPKAKGLTALIVDPKQKDSNLANHYNVVHLNRNEKGEITLNGKPYESHPAAEALLDTKFTKSGVTIFAKSGDGNFKQSEVAGLIPATGDPLKAPDAAKKLIAAKDSNLHLIDVHTEPVIDAHVGDKGFQDYLKADPTKNQQLLDLLKVYKNPNKTLTDAKVDFEVFGDKLHDAWKKYINQ